MSNCRSAPVAACIACGASTLLQACGNSATATWGGISHRAAPPLTYADYPALSSRRPSGIRVTTLAQARAAGTAAKGPIWVKVKPLSARAVLPDISTAREVRHEGMARIWLSKSIPGPGICLLAFRPELATDAAKAHTVYATCGGPEVFDRGTGPVQVIVTATQTVAVGAVPAGVSRVSAQIGGGASKTYPVRDNTYAITVAGPLRGIAFRRHGIQNQVELLHTGG
jgi:hypothetical protein